MLSEVTHGTTVESLFPVFDGNGNIVEYLGVDGSIKVHFEFDSFGQKLVEIGAEAQTVDYGFSTRVVDRDLGLNYYALRYLNVVNGRWLNRDPIFERGGENLYGFIGNNSISRWDRLGLDGGAYDTDYPDQGMLNFNGSINKSYDPKYIGKGAWEEINRAAALHEKVKKETREANKEFDRRFHDFRHGAEKRNFTYGPYDAWTQVMMRKPIYDRMRIKIRERAKASCETGVLDVDGKWDDNVNEAGWAQPLIDGLGYLGGSGVLKSLGSTETKFWILTVDCCKKEVHYYAISTDSFRFGSMRRIPWKDDTAWDVNWNEVPSGEADNPNGAGNAPWNTIDIS